MSIFSMIDNARLAGGFLTISQTMGLKETNNTVFDPFSTLLSSHLDIGEGNVFFPGVTITIIKNGSISICNHNVFYSGALFMASHGSISIGSHNQFGEGGFTAKANRVGASIEIRSHGRYVNNAAVFGASYLGEGSQIIGNIIVDSCRLNDGGSYAETNPDKRGALLKGWGLARNLDIPTGHVIDGYGKFAKMGIQPQSHFHPKVK